MPARRFDQYSDVTALMDVVLRSEYRVADNVVWGDLRRTRFGLADRPALRPSVRQLIAYFAAMTALVIVTVHAAFAVFHAVERSDLAKSASLAAQAARDRNTRKIPPLVDGVRQVLRPDLPQQVSKALVAEDLFEEMIKSESFWQRRRSGKSQSNSGSRSNGNFGNPSRLGRNPSSSSDGPGQALFAPWTFGGEAGWDDREPEVERAEPRQRAASRNFRTMCVRLCDGYYWPVSFASSESRFSTDAKTCSDSCTSPARLFVYRNPGEQVEDMRDLSGTAYATLRTAFLYRTAYDGNCKCRPHAWEEASLDRHRLYALNAKRRKGDRTVASEIGELRRKVRRSERDQREQRRRLRQSELKGWSTISAAAMPPAPPRRAIGVANAKLQAPNIQAPNTRPEKASTFQASSQILSSGDTNRQVAVNAAIGISGPPANPRRTLEGNKPAQSGLPRVVDLSTANDRVKKQHSALSQRSASTMTHIEPSAQFARSQKGMGFDGPRMSLGARQAIRRPAPRVRTEPRQPRRNDDWRRRVFEAD